MQLSEAVPRDWETHHASLQINEQVDLPKLAWWQAFQDEELNDFIAEALSHNNNVRSALANIEYAQGKLKQVQLAWVPGVSLLTGYTQMPYFGDPGSFYWLMPSYTLNLFQQIHNEKKAHYQLEASQYTKDSIKLTVIGQVLASYFTLLAQQETLAISYRLLQRQQALLKFYQSQHRSGLIALDTIDQLESTLQKTRADIALTQHNIHLASNALHYLLNQNPGSFPLHKKFNQIDPQAIIVGNLPLTVLNHRPDVQAALATVKAADANIDVSKANLLPSLQLDTAFGQSFTTKSSINLNEAYANIPLLNPPVFGQIDASKAQYKAAYIQYEDTVRAALRDVENALSAYGSSPYDRTRKAYILQEHQCRLVDARYRQGIDSATEVMQCQVTLDQQALLLNQYKLEKMVLLVDLYQELAGGYATY